MQIDALRNTRRIRKSIRGDPELKDKERPRER